MHFRSAAIALLLAGPGIAQTLTWFEGSSAANLDVYALSEAFPDAPAARVAEGLEILPIEMAGRTRRQSLELGAARLETRNGLPRLELPGCCRVFEYRRQGGAHWGYLFVGQDGAPRIVLERPGVGAAGSARPFADRVGIDSNGNCLMVAQPGVGLHLMRLDGGVFAATNSPYRLVPFAPTVMPASLMLGATHAFFTTLDGRIHRLALDAGAPEDCSPAIAAPGGFARDEIGVSGDGTTAVFLYGDDNRRMRIYLLRGTGPALMLSPPASKYEEPGYLPEGTGDHRLQLNHDATRLFYIDGIVRDESHLLDTTGVLGDLQITQDAIFTPYIGIHILPSFKGNTLVAAIGDPDRMDWYTAELQPQGQHVVRNMTGTGSMAQPYTSGVLVPGKLKLVGNRAIVTDQNSAGATTATTMRAIDLVTHTAVVLQGDLQADPVGGSATVGAPDLLVQGATDRIYQGGSGALLASAPAGVRLAPPIAGPDFGLIDVTLDAQWSLVAAYLPDGTAVPVWVVPQLRQLTLTHSQRVVVNQQLGSYLLGAGVPTTLLPLGPAPAIRVFVNGAGG